MSAVPPFDVALDDHGYMLDLNQQGQPWRHESIPLLRPIFIGADSLGEKDINPESLWRFSDRDWTSGAGQRRADLPDSVDSRFWRSRGVNVWTKWQVSLLNDFALTGPGAGGSAAHMFTVGNILYKQDASGSPEFDGLTFGAPNFSSVVEGAAVFGACTDGNLVYYTDSSAVFQATPGVAGAGSTFNTQSGVDQLYYVSGRLIGVGALNHILDIQAGAGTEVTDLGTLPGNFAPVDMTSGTQAIYIAAVNEDTGQSQVFAITIDTSSGGAATLNAPVAVTPPFTGTLRRVLFHEGLVFLGSKQGVRMASPSSDGLNLTIGPLIITGNCSALAGFDGQVWFGIDAYELDDSGVTYWAGLGRINPAVINADGAPAWAADVMTSGVASSAFPVVVEAVFDQNGFLSVLTTQGYGVRNSINLCASGYIDSGLISYDLPDEKSPRYLTVKTDMSSAGDIVPSIAADGSSTFTVQPTVPAGTATQRSPITGVPVAGEFEIRETLNRDASDHTKGAVLTRHMIEADPIVASGFFLYVPVELSSTVADRNGKDQPVDVIAERTYLYGLRENGTQVTYQELGYPAVTVTVEDVQWFPTHRTDDNQAANGTCVLKLKTV